MTGYKTIIVAALVAVFGALQGLDWVHLLPMTTGPETAGWIATGIGVVMGILRFLTNTPIGKSS